jgi:hypothetical protein
MDCKGSAFARVEGQRRSPCLSWRAWGDATRQHASLSPPQAVSHAKQLIGGKSRPGRVPGHSAPGRLCCCGIPRHRRATGDPGDLCRAEVAQRSFIGTPPPVQRQARSVAAPRPEPCQHRRRPQRQNVPRSGGGRPGSPSRAPIRSDSAGRSNPHANAQTPPPRSTGNGLSRLIMPRHCAGRSCPSAPAPDPPSGGVLHRSPAVRAAHARTHKPLRGGNFFTARKRE